MSWCRYICCPCLLCCMPSGRNEDKGTHPDPNMLIDTVEPKDDQNYSLQDDQNYAQSIQDYDDLQHLATVRQIRVTIRKGTKAGIAAGLSVTAGVIMAGPVGAVVGGAIGTAMASKIAKDVVPLKELLANTPPKKRKKVLEAFNTAFMEEFTETIQGSPELKLLMGGTSIFGVVRYMVDRDIIENEQLEKLDFILRKIV